MVCPTTRSRDQAVGSARRDARVPLHGPPVAGHRRCQPGRCALLNGHDRACPGVGLVRAAIRPVLPGPRQSPGSAGTWLPSERPWAQPGRCVAPLYGLAPGPSGEVRDRCVRLNGLEPGRILVGALHRAAARAANTTKKGEGEAFTSPFSSATYGGLRRPIRCRRNPQSPSRHHLGSR